MGGVFAQGFDREYSFLLRSENKFRDNLLVTIEDVLDELAHHMAVVDSDIDLQLVGQTWREVLLSMSPLDDLPSDAQIEQICRAVCLWDQVIVKKAGPGKKKKW